MSGSSFTSNSAGTDGGGLANFGTATVSGSSFTSNSAGSGGGGLANERGGTATVSGSSFTSNSAGPMAAASSTLRDGDGERQHLHQQLRQPVWRRPRQRDWRTATVSGSTFTSNSAGVDGGGINGLRDADARTPPG